MHAKFNLHPFLFALFPVFYLLSQSSGELSLIRVVPLFAVVLVFAGIVLVLSRVIFGAWSKAAIFSSVIVLLFFSYGYVYNFFYALGFKQYYIPHHFLLPLWAAIIAYSAYLLIRSKSNWVQLGKTATVMAVVLISTSVVPAGIHAFLRTDSTETTALNPDETALKKPAGPRDVYYIILDQYASNWELKELYGYDNKDFTEFLKNSGFYVADESRSNYNLTRLTLPAALNMNYLHNLKPDGYTQTDLNNLAKNNAVGRIFKEFSYKYIQMGSGWEISAHNPYADTNINNSLLEEPFLALYGTTVLAPIDNLIFGIKGRIERYAQRARTLNQIEQLEKIPEIKEPTFTFIHFSVPHPPFAFNQDGSLNKEDRTPPDGWKHNPEEYLNQLIFVNRSIESSIKNILKKSEKKPIIVLQSDHGARVLSTKGINFTEEADDTTLRDHLRNFGAYHLPNGGEKYFYKDITPVNVFRIIFNNYFGGNFETLPDKSYMDIHQEGMNPVDVTDRVKEQD